MLQELIRIEELVKGSKIIRLLSRPWQYIKAFSFKYLIYPMTKAGKLGEVMTFFDSKMKILLPSSMDLYLFGAKTHQSEIRLARLLLNKIKPGMTLIDVGAHFGYFSLLASKLIGTTGKILSLEASKEVHKVLIENTGHQQNIEIQHLACSDQDGQLEFFEFPILYSEYNSLDIEVYKDSSWMKRFPPSKNRVKSRSLDSLVKEKNLKPDFIKIDVEGAEELVAKGMRTLLSELPGLLISMEYLIQDTKKTYYNAAKTFANSGFKSHIINSHGELEFIEIDAIITYMQKEGLDSDNIVFARGLHS